MYHHLKKPGKRSLKIGKQLSWNYQVQVLIYYGSYSRCLIARNPPLDPVWRLYPLLLCNQFGIGATQMQSWPVYGRLHLVIPACVGSLATIVPAGVIHLYTRRSPFVLGPVIAESRLFLRIYQFCSYQMVTLLSIALTEIPKINGSSRSH